MLHNLMESKMGSKMQLSWQEASELASLVRVKFPALAAALEDSDEVLIEIIEPELE